MIQLQLFPDLRPDEYEALKADIAKRGILVPVEFDQAGALLDGHHRLRIGAELGIEVPRVTRIMASDEDRIAHVIALNLKRRHLDPVTWGEMFLRYAEARGVRVGTQGRQSEKTATVAVLAGELGVPERTARYRLEVATELPEKIKDQVRTGERTARTALQEHKRTQRIEAAEDRAHDGSRTPPSATKLYQTIVIDPPWAYDRNDIRGAAEHHYDTMTFDQIAAYPVGDLAGDEAHLYVWVTNPHMPHVWWIIEAWGFEYKTLLTWVKPQMGTGHYFRGATEHVLFCTRGNLPLRDNGIPNWFEADRQEHSRKPESFYELVERASFGPFVELFARRTRDGWDGHGDELPSA